MKKAEYFLLKAPLWKIFILFLFVATAMFFFSFELILSNGPENPNVEVTPEKNLIFSIVVGSFVSGTIAYMLSLTRMSEKFYTDCNTLEEKIKEAKTRDALQVIYVDLFTPLSRRAWHMNQKIRLKYIHSSMVKKLEGIKSDSDPVENPAE